MKSHGGGQEGNGTVRHGLLVLPLLRVTSLFKLLHWFHVTVSDYGNGFRLDCV